jgi:hypothetical protein
MKRFLVKLVLLVLPFAVIAAIVARVDPFEYFPWGAGKLDEARRDIAYRMSPPLWKLTALRRQPAPHILLGDSRMASLDAAQISAQIGAPVANLGYGGGSLDEAIKTFWVVDRIETLRSATFGINLDLYNESNSKDRVTPTEKILRNPALYLCDRIVLRTTWYDLALAATGRHPALGVPPMDKDAFWRYQLDVTARIAYSSYRYPDQYRRRLEEIAEHCRQKNIRLRFLVFPEHRDLAGLAARYGLEGAAARMKSDLSSVGETVDLGGMVDTGDRSLFIDPYHFTPVVGERLIHRVWAGTPDGS